jgi:metallo-beta-lactamase class B
MIKAWVYAAVTGASLAIAGIALAQQAALKPGVQAHLDAAKRAAGTEFVAGTLLCNQILPESARPKSPTFASLRAEGGTPGAQPEAYKVFDNFYFLGIRSVTAWAVTTPQGIILIDALDNKLEADTVIETGMRQLGLDPAQIKYIVVTHGHGDHFGGAKYLADKYKARVLMSEADWTQSQAPSRFDPAPAKDMVITDGQKLTLGGETLTFYITPGHTLGTVSILIPLKDRGQSHVGALWGGTGFNFTHSAERFKQYAGSAQRFSALSIAAGADVPLSNHPENDSALKKIDALKKRGANDPNPFVMGQDAVKRYFTVFQECAQAFGANM